MNHQDWNEVVFRKNNGIKPNNGKKYEVTKEQKIDNETENLKHKNLGSDIGIRIQRARIAGGFKTQKNLANSINVRPDIIASYESGKAIPDNNILQRLRRVLKTKL